MPIKRSEVQIERFNRESMLPFELRINDIQMAMQDVYDFFYDVNSNLSVKGLKRLDDMLRPAVNRRPMKFKEVYLAEVTVDDFRKNSRGELGTRTATLHRGGLAKLRGSWIYKDLD